MRGQDTQQAGLFGYLSPEARVPVTHPFGPIRHSVDTALNSLSPTLTKLYAPHRSALDRPGEAPAGVVAAGALQYSERTTPDGTIGLQPVVPLVSLPGLDAPVWDVTVCLEGEVATAFFQQVLAQARPSASCPMSTIPSTGH